jgi:cysteine desulfurase / selenocysteine lyase
MATEAVKDTPLILDTEAIRKDFPILAREIMPGVPLIYLDSAATSQKPDAVINSMSDYYRLHNANIHRAVHRLAEEATELYEGARRKVMHFVDAASPQEIIFTRNATEGINLVMRTWATANLHAGDLILLTEMEHHSNMVPWQILAQEKNIHIEYIPVTAGGVLDLEACRRLLARGPKLVSISHMSNMLGTINPLEEIIPWAHAAGARVVVDGAQAVPHMPISVQTLDADFYAFSSHKMLGPTGIGVLYGKRDLLEAIAPFMGGGDMIRRVSYAGFEPAALPHKLEAGTPAIAEAVGLGAAVDYLVAVGLANIHAHEQALARYAMDRLTEVPGTRIFGPSADKRGGLVAFSMDIAHPHDVAQILDSRGIAVRAGHHCAMPLHEKLGVSATTRASFYLYSTFAEIDALIEGLAQVRRIFG